VTIRASLEAIRVAIVGGNSRNEHVLQEGDGGSAAQLEALMALLARVSAEMMMSPTNSGRSR